MKSEEMQPIRRMCTPCIKTEFGDRAMEEIGVIKGLELDETANYILIPLRQDDKKTTSWCIHRITEECDVDVVAWDNLEKKPKLKVLAAAVLNEDNPEFLGELMKKGVDAVEPEMKRQQEARRVKKVYLSQVTCKDSNCYQFVTESFKKDHPDLEILEYFEQDAVYTTDETEAKN